MKCNKCGKEFRVGQEQIGVNENNIPILKTFCYCDTCKIKYDYEATKKAQPKKESTLSIISCVFASIIAIPAFLIGIPHILAFPMFFVALILGLIDIGINNKEKSHLGSIVALIFSILYFIFLMVSCGV